MTETRRRRQRERKDRALKLAGASAVGFALAALAVLLISVGVSARDALTQSHVRLETRINPDDDPNRNDPRILVRNAFLEATASDDEANPSRRQRLKLLSRSAPAALRRARENNPQRTEIVFRAPLADVADQYLKGRLAESLASENPLLSETQVAALKKLKRDGRIESPLNIGLLVNPDSRLPEAAGLLGALVGSFYALLVCAAVSLPVGIAAAVKLEEFPPKSKLGAAIEVAVNNLAATPSIVFGLLGLSFFIGVLGMPRSAPLVGGMTLALMTMPTVVIAARAAIKGVPQSLRDAALALGASKNQALLHHVLPAAMPGICTGAIIGLAQALGETAPLLLIGMNAFISSAPGGIADPASSLPTQILIWADSPERGFVPRASAAIVVLLAFMLVMNALAVYIRQRLQS